MPHFTTRRRFRTLYVGLAALTCSAGPGRQSRADDRLGLLQDPAQMGSSRKLSA